MMSVVTAMRDLLARQRQIVEDKVSAPTYQGTVMGVDGTTATVLLDGGDSLGTPCQMRVACAEGDRVSVTVEGHAAYVTGNMSKPATDDTVASAAQAIANAVNQHFWHDGQGVHVTEAPNDATTEHNILINSLGILLRHATAPLMALSASAVAFYDGLGNSAANIVARFGKDGSQIGRDGESHVELDYHSMKMVDSDGDTYFYVSDLRNESGVLEVTATFTGEGDTVRFAFSLQLRASDRDYAVLVDGVEVTSGVTKTYEDIIFDTPPSDGSIISVTYNTKSKYAKAFTLGTRSTNSAVGPMSLAEGSDTEASGFASHAEGDITNATGRGSHAEGYGSTASGGYSHAEGRYAEATGAFSHAQNIGTRAYGSNQTAIGSYNVEDTSNKYALIIGNGTFRQRSNALTVDWLGNVWAAGKTTLTGAVEAASATISDALSAASATVTGTLTAGDLATSSDVPWTLLTLDSACHAYNDVSANAPRYRRWGQLVTITGIIAPTSEVAAGGNMPIATLPTGVRPPQEINIKCQGSKRAAWNLKITAAGVMSAQRYGDENGAQAMGTGIWMPFTVTYLV